MLDEVIVPPVVDKAPNDDNVGRVWSPVLVPDRLEADTAPKKVAVPAAVIKAFPPPLPTWKAPSVLSTPVPQYIPLDIVVLVYSQPRI